MGQPWYETVPDGGGLHVALLAVDLAGSSNNDEGRRRFQRIVEQVVLEFGGKVGSWRGDGPIAYFHDPEGAPESAAFKAGQRILERLQSEGGLVPRMVVHSGLVRYARNADRDATGATLDETGHLLDCAPRQAILVTAPAVEGLPNDLRSNLGFFGTSRRDGVPCFHWPLHIAGAPDPKHFLPVTDDVWPIQARYLERVRESFRVVPLLGLRLTPNTPLAEIDQIFVSPEVVLVDRRRKGFRDLEGSSDAAPLGALEHQVDRPTRKLDLKEAICRDPHLMLMGGPGAGKTTVVRWLARLLATGGREARRMLPTLPGLMPVVCPGAALGSALRRGQGLLAGFASFWEAEGVADCARLFQKLMEERRAFLLVDGLDELLEAGDRVHAARALERLTQEHADLRILVTTRPAAVRGSTLGTFTSYELQPLDRGHLKGHVRSWFQVFEQVRTPAPAGVDARASKAAETFVADLAEKPDLLDLLRNPLLLTLGCLIHRQGARLPRHRVRLYEWIAETLVESWDEARSLGSRPVKTGRDYWADVKKVLGPLALRLQASGVTEIEEPELRDLVGDQGLSEIRTSTHLLVQSGPGRWSFLHRTFQEFFAARQIVSRPGHWERDLLPRVFDPSWTEVQRLAAGILGLLQSREEEATALLRGILEVHDPLRSGVLRWNLVLASDCLVDAGGAADQALVSEISDEVCQLALESPFERLRAVCARRLPSLDAIGSGSMSAWFRALRDPKATTRRAAAAGAARYFTRVTPELHEGLLKACRDPSALVRVRAVLALGALEPDDPEVIEALLGCWESDRDPEVRHASLQALGAARHPQSRVLDALFKGLRDPASSFATARLFEAGWARTPSVVQELLKWLREGRPEKRTAAAWAIRALGPPLPEAIAPLLKRLADPDPIVSAAAAQALAWIGLEDPEVLRGLSERVRTGDPRVASVIGLALAARGKRTEPLVSGILERWAREPQSPWIRMAAAHVLPLSTRPADESAEAFQQFIRDPVREVRLAALSIALHDPARPDVRQNLRRLLLEPDPDWEVRQNCAIALTQALDPDPSVISALSSRLADPDAAVRDAAFRGLNLLALAQAGGAAGREGPGST